MLAGISARLFAEWMAYFAIEPWGELMADARNASLMALLANIHRGEHQSAYRIDDFRIMREPQTWQEQKAMFEALTTGFPRKRKLDHGQSHGTAPTGTAPTEDTNGG